MVAPAKPMLKFAAGVFRNAGLTAAPGVHAVPGRCSEPVAAACEVVEDTRAGAANNGALAVDEIHVRKHTHIIESLTGRCVSAGVMHSDDPPPGCAPEISHRWSAGITGLDEVEIRRTGRIGQVADDVCSAARIESPDVGSSLERIHVGGRTREAHDGDRCSQDSGWPGIELHERAVLCHGGQHGLYHSTTRRRRPVQEQCEGHVIPLEGRHGGIEARVRYAQSSALRSAGKAEALERWET